MPKYFFFGLPLVSVHKAFISVMKELASRDNIVIYYNTEEFSSKDTAGFITKTYPSYTAGYNTSRIDNYTSLFSFSEMLLDTTIALFDFLRNEVATERPDLIAHSHLALWGKLIAIDRKIPATCIYTTFSLSRQIMIPFIRDQRQQTTEKAYNGVGIESAMRLHRKYQSFFKKAGFTFKPDIWDAYINKEDCNIFLILKALSYDDETVDERNRFVGYPVNKPGARKNKSVIYASMGTIFNKEVELLKLIIDALGCLPVRSIVSIGSTISQLDIGMIPPNVTVVDFVDQESVLAEAIFFISRGGMASIHEAIASETPLIVIPEIFEQQLTAQKVERLNIGIQLSAMQLTKNMLLTSMEHMLSNVDHYNNNLKALISVQPQTPPSTLAADVIEEYYSSCYGCKVRK